MESNNNKFLDIWMVLLSVFCSAGLIVSAFLDSRIGAGILKLSAGLLWAAASVVWMINLFDDYGD